MSKKRISWTLVGLLTAINLVILVLTSQPKKNEEIKKVQLSNSIAHDFIINEHGKEKKIVIKKLPTVDKIKLFQLEKKTI
jgi:hypothetical protein